MRILNQFGNRSLVVAASLTISIAAIAMTSCEGRGSGLGNPAKAQTNSPPAPERVEPWTTDRLVQADELAKIVSNPTAGNPLILYVGPAVLYRRGHIPGAKYVGPASEPDGLNALKTAVQGVGKDTQIVVYCGCCPWNVCPNVRPAFTKLQELGFTNAKVLHLPNNMRQNWVNKGYPVEKEKQ